VQLLTPTDEAAVSNKLIQLEASFRNNLAIQNSGKSGENF
jgi:hypothetical protein